MTEFLRLQCAGCALGDITNTVHRCQETKPGIPPCACICLEFQGIALDAALDQMDASWGSPVSALCVAAERLDDPPLHEKCRKIGCTCTCHAPRQSRDDPRGH